MVGKFVVHLIELRFLPSFFFASFCFLSFAISNRCLFGQCSYRTFWQRRSKTCWQMRTKTCWQRKYVYKVSLFWKAMPSIYAVLSMQ